METCLIHRTTYQFDQSLLGGTFGYYNHQRMFRCRNEEKQQLLPLMLFTRLLCPCFGIHAIASHMEILNNQYDIKIKRFGSQQVWSSLPAS